MIKTLEAKIAQCRICVDNPVGVPLPHQPRPVVRLSSTARICIAGQAPGLRVHKSGIPFTDPSGDRLREWMGIKEDVFYDQSRIAVVPMGFCFPGYSVKKSDLPPRRECAATWHDQIFEAMPKIELLFVIGQYAQAYHLGDRREKTVTATVAKWRQFANMTEGPTIVPLPHPSWRNNGWLRKNPWFESELLPVVRRQVQHCIS